MERFCDLHTHSLFSDGTYTPAQLIDAAVDAGLAALALTDHNTVDGVADFLAAGEGKPIEVIPGIEFSVDYDGTELHLLGLYLPPESLPGVSALMEDFIRRKEESSRALVEALNKAGYEISYESILAATGNGYVNRAHIAAALTEQGYTASVKEAFARLLRPEAGYYVPPRRPDVWEMIGYIRQIHAVPVLAHPFLNLTDAQLTAFLPEAKKLGLAGMECFYSTYDAQTAHRSLELADAYGLLYSGGSDFHGAVKPDISLGWGKGDLRIPLSWAEALKGAIE